VDFESRGIIQLQKLSNWMACVELSDPTSEVFAQRLVDGFSCVGAHTLVAMPLPFYLDDGPIAYEGELSISSVLEIAEAWAPFDYVLAGFARTDDLPLGMAYASFNDYCLLLGVEGFLKIARSNEDIANQEAGGYDYLQHYRRAADAVMRYAAQREGCTIEF